MKDAIKRIKAKGLTAQERTKFASAVSVWRSFMAWLAEQADEEELLKCLVFEIENDCRPAIVDRLRTRFNTLRAIRELRELEETTGKVISLNFKK